MESAVKAGIRIFPDAPGLARGAAALVAATAADVLASGNRCSLALSGGATPRLLFRLLCSEYSGKIAWDRVHLFWADERAVPPDHAQSNFGMAHAELIAKIAIPPENIHRIQGELSPPEAAALYEKDLKNYFGEAGIPDFDLILLGVGEDGHTASLFPGSAALSERHRLAIPVYSSAAANWRITLTLPVLNNARRVVFLASGAAKAGIVGEIHTRGRGAEYPAGTVRPVRGKLFWFLDREAAANVGRPRDPEGCW